MQLTMFKAKIHRATITESRLDYMGSVSIDRALMDAAGLLPHEQIDILNINNGERFTSYVIEAPAGSGDIVINGAAARLVQKGDLVILCAYAIMSEDEAKRHEPTIVHVDGKNKVVR